MSSFSNEMSNVLKCKEVSPINLHDFDSFKGGFTAEMTLPHFLFNNKAKKKFDVQYL